MRSVFHLAREQGLSLAVLWYWPRGLKAVAHMSHDSDGNDPGKASALLEVMNRCGIKSTWCMLYPGGYPREFYRTPDATAVRGCSALRRHDRRRKDILVQGEFLAATQLVDERGGPGSHHNQQEPLHTIGKAGWTWRAGAKRRASKPTKREGPSKKGTIGVPLGRVHNRISRWMMRRKRRAFLRHSKLTCSLKIWWSHALPNMVLNSWNPLCTTMG